MICASFYRDTPSLAAGLFISSPRTGQSRALYDFAHILFEERADIRLHGSTSYRLRLHACKTEEESRKYSGDVLTLLQRVLPKLSLKTENISLRQASEQWRDKHNAQKEYYAYIILGVEGMTQLVRYYHDFVSLGDPQPTWLAQDLR